MFLTAVDIIILVKQRERSECFHGSLTSENGGLEFCMGLNGKEFLANVQYETDKGFGGPGSYLV